MRLTSIVAIPEVRAKITPLRPKLPRRIAVPLKVEPKSNRHGIVGTAFDYLLRFELQRRAPHAVAKRWVADNVPDMLWKQNEEGPSGGWDVLLHADPDLYMPPEEVGRLARQIVEQATAAVAAYIKTKRPKRAQQAELAAHAVRLAKLDPVLRVLRLDPRFQEADAEDVEDLLALLSIVPFESLLHSKTMLLNPTFGQTSLLVGGADADLITGDMLVDFKTTMKGEMTAANLDQLLGYFLLARHEREADPAFPAINRLAFYYCRHGYLWTLGTDAWTTRPEFPEVERWFFEYAARAKEAASRSASGRESDQAKMPISLAEWPGGIISWFLSRKLTQADKGKTLGELMVEQQDWMAHFSRQNGGMSAMLAEVEAEQRREGLQQT